MGTPVKKMTLSDALFNKTQQAVLGFIFTHLDEAYHLREIVRQSDIGQGTVQRELKKLTEAGIIHRELRGRQTFFRANQGCPIFPDLHGLVIKTFGVAQKVAAGLKTIENRIRVAFIYGSFARGGETEKSDIDLLVIGDLNLRDVVKSMSETQQNLGREINPTIYKPDEYRRMLAEGHHFLISLYKEPKIFLIGNEDDFRRLG